MGGWSGGGGEGRQWGERRWEMEIPVIRVCDGDMYPSYEGWYGVGGDVHATGVGGGGGSGAAEGLKRAREGCSMLRSERPGQRANGWCFRRVRAPRGVAGQPDRLDEASGGGRSRRSRGRREEALVHCDPFWIGWVPFDVGARRLRQLTPRCARTTQAHQRLRGRTAVRAAVGSSHGHAPGEGGGSREVRPPPCADTVCV